MTRSPLHRLLAAAVAAALVTACGAAPVASRLPTSDDAARWSFAPSAAPATSGLAAHASDEPALARLNERTGWRIAGATNEADAPAQDASAFRSRERGGLGDDAVPVDVGEDAAEPGAAPMTGFDRAGTVREPATDVGFAATEDYTASVYGIETELLQPFVPEVGVITFKGSKTLWGKNGESHGDALLGVFLRPNVSHDVVDTIDEYQASIGYRHYFWQGLHAEVQYLAGYVWGKNNLVDGKDYEGFVQFAEANIGYRIDFAKDQQRGFYIIPQFGYIQGLNEELIIGPRNGKDDTFWQGKLLVGYRF